MGALDTLETTEMNNEPMTISVIEAGKHLGLSVWSSYEAARRGDIPTIRIGRRLRVPVRALEAMVDEAMKRREPASHKAARDARI
jgi:hypothetical protein